MSKTNELINMFITEGLVDGNMMPAELPKLDGNIQQNKATQTPSNKLEVPTDAKDKIPTNKPDLPKDLKDKGDKSDYKMALEASHQCLSLAEYHLGKLNKMKEIEEGEDINLDKIGAAHKIITDTKQALQEMISKYKDSEKSEEPKEKEAPKEEKPVQEAVETKPEEKEISLEMILKNPKQYITSPLDKNDFVQAGSKRLSLVNEKFFHYKNQLLLNLRETMFATMKKEAGDLPFIFCIGDKRTYYFGDKKMDIMVLTPFERQATAAVIAGDLLNPEKQEMAKRKLLQLK